MHLKRFIKDINKSDGKIFHLTRNRIFQIIREISDKTDININFIHFNSTNNYFLIIVFFGFLILFCSTDNLIIQIPQIVQDP